MKILPLCLVSILGFLCACSTADKETELLLQGRWDGDSWFVEDQLKNYDMSRIYFEFRDGNRYDARLGDSFEKGTYRVYGDKLYTQNGAAAQIVTNIQKVTTDSLVINMNRGGQREQLILTRKSE
jgi:hypothetical protein